MYDEDEVKFFDLNEMKEDEKEVIEVPGDYRGFLGDLFFSPGLITSITFKKVIFEDGPNLFIRLYAADVKVATYITKKPYALEIYNHHKYYSIAPADDYRYVPVEKDKNE